MSYMLEGQIKEILRQKFQMNSSWSRERLKSEAIASSGLRHKNIGPQISYHT